MDTATLNHAHPEADPHAGSGNASSARGSTSGSNDAPPSRFVDDDPPPVKRKKRRSTSHLKDVPETLAQREAIKAAAEQLAAGLDKSQPFTKDQLEQHGRTLLADMGLSERFLGFAMVLIGNFFGKRQFLATPFEKRLLLLPHCLKHAEGCPAEY
ncbi:MAG: DUF116 domain-containing protein, partial [Planctomycetaceae bacterium]